MRYVTRKHTSTNLWIRKRSEPIVVLLTSRIPQTKRDWIAINDDISAVVVEYCGYIFALFWLFRGASTIHPTHRKCTANYELIVNM